MVKIPCVDDVVYLYLPIAMFSFVLAIGTFAGAIVWGIVLQIQAAGYVASFPLVALTVYFMYRDLPGFFRYAPWFLDMCWTVCALCCAITVEDIIHITTGSASSYDWTSILMLQSAVCVAVYHLAKYRHGVVMSTVSAHLRLAALLRSPIYGCDTEKAIRMLCARHKTCRDLISQRVMASDVGVVPLLDGVSTLRLSHIFRLVSLDDMRFFVLTALLHAPQNDRNSTPWNRLRSNAIFEPKLSRLIVEYL